MHFPFPSLSSLVDFLHKISHQNPYGNGCLGNARPSNRPVKNKTQLEIITKIYYNWSGIYIKYISYSGPAWFWGAVVVSAAPMTDAVRWVFVVVERWSLRSRWYRDCRDDQSTFFSYVSLRWNYLIDRFGLGHLNKKIPIPAKTCLRLT